MIKINSITYEDDITVVTLNNFPADAGFLTEIFGEIANSGVSLDMISQTAPTGGSISLSFTLADADFPKALKVIGLAQAKKPGCNCEVSSGNCKVNFTDSSMPAACGVAYAIFGIFNRAGVQIKLVTTSAETVSVLYDRYSAPELQAEIERSVVIG
jgi:aspartate kinase